MNILIIMDMNNKCFNKENIQILKNLEEHLTNLIPSIKNDLNDQIRNKEDINIAISMLGYKDYIIPNELYELFLWHNGTNTIIGEEKQSYILDSFYFPPLGYLNNEILLSNEVFKLTQNKLFPIFTSFNGELLAIKLNEKGGLFLCQTWDIEINSVESIYDSIISMAKTAIEFMTNNVYVLDPYGRLTLNFDEYDQYIRIGKKYNPSSKYWRKIR